MNLRTRQARRRWRAFMWRAQLALLDVRAVLRCEVLRDLEAHVVEALARQDTQGSEAERLESALRRVGDPMRVLRPLLEQTRAAPRLRGARLFAAAAAALGAAALGAALVYLGVASLIRPENVGLFYLGGDTYQVRLSGAAEIGAPLAAPWFSLLSGAIGGCLLWVGRRQALRVVAAVMLKGEFDE